MADHLHCTPGSYAGDILVILPGGRTVSLDPCIVNLVCTLNRGGIRTVASCCGHGHRPGRISLDDGRELFIAEGYDEACVVAKAFGVDIHGEKRR